MKISSEKAYWAAVATDFSVFLKQAFITVHPGEEYMGNWHIEAIVNCLEQCIAGGMPRLIVNMPPRHLKSFVMTIALPAYLIGRDPTVKIICVSYSDDLATILSRSFRTIVQSKWYQDIFPQVVTSKSTETNFVTTLGGYRYATSVNGSLTGIGGDFIIIDDPMKPEEVMSDRIRNNTNDWFRRTLLSRLQSKDKSVLIIVMQRLHVNDLTGFVENSGGYHKLSLPAIAIINEEIPISSGEMYFRQAGEALHDSRESKTTLESIKDQISPFIFSAQYQQNPECPDGAMFKLAYMNRVSQAPIFEPGDHLCISIDTAISTSDTADYTAICVMHSKREGHYVVYAERGHWDFDQLRYRAMAYGEKYSKKYGCKPLFVIEAIGIGHALCHFMRNARFNVQPYIPEHDKTSRAYTVLSVISVGRFFIVDQPGSNEWVNPLINEMLIYPNGRYDDQVDSVVQAINWMEPKVRCNSKFHGYGTR